MEIYYHDILKEIKDYFGPFPAGLGITSFFATSNATYYSDYETNFRNNGIYMTPVNSAPGNEKLKSFLGKFLDENPHLKLLMENNLAMIAGSCANSIITGAEFDPKNQDIDIFINPQFCDYIGMNSDEVKSITVDDYDIQLITLHHSASPVQLFRKFANTVQCFASNPATGENYTTNISLFHEENKVLMPLLRSNMKASYLKSIYKYIRKGYSLYPGQEDFILYEWVSGLSKMSIEDMRNARQAY